MPPMAWTRRPRRATRYSSSAPKASGFSRWARPASLGTAVIVLGHAKYYPRFGFQPASRFALGCEYDVPDDVFMALELEPGILAGKTGTIRYHPAFFSA